MTSDCEIINVCFSRPPRSNYLKQTVKIGLLVSNSGHDRLSLLVFSKSGLVNDIS